VDLDDRLVLPGAEGIDLDVVLSGIASRGAAVIIDLVLETLAILLFSFVAGIFGDPGIAVYAIAIFMITLGYPTLMEAFNGGRTVGKLALGIAVVSTDGTPASFLAVAIRNIIRPIDALPAVYTVGLVSALVTKKVQRLGDLAGGTIVVRRTPSHVATGSYQDGMGAPGQPWPATGPGGWGAPGAWGPNGWMPAPLPEAPVEIAAWDTSAVTVDELAAVRAFLVRRHELPPQHRYTIAVTLAGQVGPKVAGIPFDGGPELLLERIAYARSFR
jgi:uncharacterized RDD family membrane protein YckC